MTHKDAHTVTRTAILNNAENHREKQRGGHNLLRLTDAHINPWMVIHNLGFLLWGKYCKSKLVADSVPKGEHQEYNTQKHSITFQGQAAKKEEASDAWLMSEFRAVTLWIVRSFLAKGCDKWSKADCIVFSTSLTIYQASRHQMLRQNFTSIGSIHIWLRLCSRNTDCCVVSMLTGFCTFLHNFSLTAPRYLCALSNPQLQHAETNVLFWQWWCSLCPNSQCSNQSMWFVVLNSYPRG